MMMQMTQGRQQQRSETPEKQQLFERQSHPINVNHQQVIVIRPRALFLPTRPEASADKSDNARRNHTLIVYCAFLFRSMRMRESHVFVSRWLKVALMLKDPSISIITTKEDGIGSQFSICSRF